MRIGELARAAGVSTDTVRFYEARGLVAADRRANGYRDFAEGTVGLIRLIRQAQDMGFTLAEIAELTGALQDGGLSGEQVAAVLREKIAELDARLARLGELRAVLQARLDAACPLGLDARTA